MSTIYYYIFKYRKNISKCCYLIYNNQCFRKLINFLHRHVVVLLCIFNFTIIAFFWYNKHQYNFSTLTTGAVYHKCTNNPILHDLIKNRSMVMFSQNGSLSCEVEALLEMLYKQNARTKAVGVLIHNCPSSPMRKAYTSTQVDQQHIDNLKFRHQLQKLFLQNKFHYKYYSFYLNKCDHFNNFIKLQNKYYNNIFGKQEKSFDLYVLPIGSYYFIHINNDILVFEEQGGVQYSSVNKDNRTVRRLVFHKYKVQEFVNSHYYQFITQNKIFFDI